MHSSNSQCEQNAAVFVTANEWEKTDSIASK